MNIFATDLCPVVSANNLCNRHISRMPLESMGMLMFAFPEGVTPVGNSRTNRHYKHPASIWCRESRDNLEWLLIHAMAQCEEYTRRYKREHDSQKHIEWVAENYTHLDLPKTSVTDFARCFGPFKEHLDASVSCTITAYREFYKLDKVGFARWPSLDKIPHWWIDKSLTFVDKSFYHGQYTKR